MTEKKAKQKQTLMQRNNILRAAVMGANDGILSVSAIVLGVAGATDNTGQIVLAGFAGMLAGAISMAMGEYMSVSSQHDAQEHVRDQQVQALADDYDAEYQFVKAKYVASGIAPELAEQATQEMMGKDPLVTTIRERYGFTPDHEVSPLAAAIASMISFPIGSLLPMIAITLVSANIRNVATFAAVVVALAMTGYSAALLNGANRPKALLRNVVSGVLTMIATYSIGTLFHQ